MITEDYVSFEVAKLLKEKGFKSDNCHTAYDENGSFFWYGDYSKDRKGIMDAPTLQMAMKWLREVHNKSIEIRSQGLKATRVGWIVEIYNLVNQDEEFHHPYTFPTYEEAAESAIRYCLENLI